MITVAIAGGTSRGLGRSIVNAFEEYPDQLRAVVLSRSSKVPDWLAETGVELRQVDYNSEDSLLDALKGVNTVISVLLAVDGSAVSTHKNLLNAALRAGVSRFAPAEFGAGAHAAHVVDILRPTIDVMDTLRETKAKHSHFEYAGFHPGLFMNYLGYGAKDEDAATHGMNDTWVYIFDVKNMKASIPLTKDGKVPSMTMTEIGDIGRYVAAACLLPKGSWKEDFMLAGDTKQLDEIVKIIENVRGEKMDVSYRVLDVIEREVAEVEVFYPDKMWLQLELVTARNEVGYGILSPTVNELFPSVKPLTFENYMKKFWT